MAGTVDKAELEHRVALWESGMSVQEMADECYVTLSGMSAYIQMHRESFRPRRRRITEGEIDMARAMYEQGMSCSEIAEVLGRHATTVHSWRRRKGWECTLNGDARN